MQWGGEQLRGSVSRVPSVSSPLFAFTKFCKERVLLSRHRKSNVLFLPLTCCTHKSMTHAVHLWRFHFLRKSQIHTGERGVLLTVGTLMFQSLSWVIASFFKQQLGHPQTQWNSMWKTNPVPYQWSVRTRRLLTELLMKAVNLLRESNY